MRKLLSLVLAFAMILGLFAFPVSADASTYLSVGQELQGLGVLKGVDAEGSLAEMKKLTREQALVVLARLMGQEDKATATEAVADFTDVPASHWAAKYVAYAKLQGWTTGVSEKEFGLGQEVTTKQVVTFMMRALGYEVDWSKEDVMKKAKELGLLEGVSAAAEDQIIRGELFIVMKNTLYTKPMGEKAALIYKLGLATNPTPATLEVVDVEAMNLKEVVVTFNQEVDKDTLKDAFRFVGASQGPLTSELKEDAKTVVVTVGNKLKNLKMYKFQVSGVKTLAGVKMEKVVKEFKVSDVEAPVVEGVKVTGPRTFQIMFSEPINTNGKLKLFVNGKASFGLTGAVDTSNDRVINVKTSTLKDGTTYTVRVEDFKDYAGYTNKIVEVEFDYAKIATSPTLEVVKATQEYVEVKFDRPVKGLKLDNFYHTFSSYKPQAAYKNMEEMNKTTPVALGTNDLKASRDSVIISFVPDVKKFVANDPATKEWKPLPAGDVKFVVTGKNIVDEWNNKFEEFEQVLNITADKEAPVVESVEVTGEKEIVVTFSKKVVVKKENYEILKEDGSKFDGLKFDVAAEGNTGVKLTVSSPKMVGKTVVLNIKDVKDKTINMNKMAAAESQTLTFGDKTFKAPTEGLYSADVANNVGKVRIKFDEALNADTATNKKNYKFIGTQKTPDFEVSMFSDKIVELVFTKEEWVKKVWNNDSKNLTDLPAGFKVVLSNQITDVAGNQFSTFSADVIIKKATDGTTSKLDSVVSKSVDRITVTFNEEVKKVDAQGNQVAFEKGDFQILDPMDKYTTDPVVSNVLSEEVNEDGKTVVELELETNKLTPCVAGAKLKVVTKVQNMLDKEMDGAQKEKAITDKIKPEHKKLPEKNEGLYTGTYSSAPADTYASLGFVFEVGDNKTTADEPAVAARWNATENRYEIVVVYNEAMEVATMSTTTFKVKGWSVGKPEYLQNTAGEDVENVVLIPLSAPDDKYKAEMFEDVTFEHVGIITDKAANTLDTLKEVKIQDTLKKEFSIKNVVTSAKQKLVAKYGTFDAEMAEYTEMPEHGKKYFVKGDHADQVNAYTAAKGKVDALNENSTVSDVEAAGKALVKAIDDIKALVVEVAVQLEAQTVKASTKTVGYVDLSQANQTTHYMLLENENKYFAKDEASGTLVQKTDEVDASDVKYTHIALVKVAQNKVVSYRIEALAGKKGVMTAAPTSLKLVDGTNPFTSGNDSSLLGESLVKLASWASGSQEHFKVQFDGIVGQTMDVEVTGTVVEGSPKSYQSVAKSTPSGEFKVTGVGKITVKVTIKEQDKVDYVLTKEITVE